MLTWLRRLPTEPRLRRRAGLTALVFSLSFVPMAGTLGYFSSLLLAPVLSLLAAAAGVDGVRQVRARAAAQVEAGDGAAAPGWASDGATALWRLSGHGARELGWLLGLSLGLLVLGQLWTINCDPFGGSKYFLLGPVISAPLGWLAGVSAAVLLPGRRRIAVLLAGWAPFFLSMLIELRRLYAEPVVFGYDPFWGWFSGSIYDESVAIGRRYWLYRGYNALVAVALWLLLRAGVDGSLRMSWRRLVVGGPNRLRTTIATALSLGALTVGLSADRLGFTATIDSLSRVLSATRETEHFVIRYDPTAVTAREIEMVVAEHEFAWHRLERMLGSAPQTKVDSFVFENGKQRGALLGANQVEVSPPWRQQMYLSQRPWPHDLLHHELAHAFLGEFGDPVLGLPISGLRLNGALVEGVPTALAPRMLDNLGLHEQAAVLDRLDKRPSLASLSGAGFWGAAARRAYTTAGSFVLWIGETRGGSTVTELYDNAGDFEASTGRDLATLEGEWIAFLRSVELRERDIEAQAQRYQLGSVFRRPCAHRAAELRSQALLARLRDQRDQALEAQQTLCRIEPEQPRHFLTLAEMHAGWGDLASAAQVLDELATREDLTASDRAVMAEQRGDTALLAGELTPAGDHYRAALEFGLDEARRRQLQVKLRATTDPELAPLVTTFFGPFELQANARASVVLRLWAAARIAEMPRHAALGNYLLGRQLLVAIAPEPALEVLDAAVHPPPGSPGLETVELRRASLWSLTSALTRLHQWDRARTTLDALEPLVEGDGHWTEIQLWRERIDFYADYFADKPVEDRR